MSLIQSARRGCYAESALREAVDIRATVSLNGVEIASRP